MGFPIQDAIILTGASKTLIIDNYITHSTETHDVYPQNEEDYLRVSNYIGITAPKFSATGNMGMFGPIDSDEPHSNDEVLTENQSKVFTLAPLQCFNQE